MNFLERLKVLGCKEFWKSFIEGVKLGWKCNVEAVKINKLFIILVLLNVILSPIMLFIEIIIILVRPSLIFNLNEMTNKCFEDLGVKTNKD